MTSATISTKQAGIIGAQVFDVTSARSVVGSATNAASRRVIVLPAWARHGTQPSYWTETWLRKERLADWDRIAGTTYEADNMDDVISHLHRAADAAQA